MILNGVEKEVIMRNIQEILKFLREEVNEKNIDEVISVFTQKLNEEGKDANYFIDNDGNSFEIAIGENHSNGGFSSDQHFIADNIKLRISNGMQSEPVYLQVDETREAYRILIDKVKESRISNFFDLVKIIYDTTVEYFGDTSEVIPNRADYYENILDTDETAYPCGKISDFKGKNMAACAERAALSQNLMRFLGIESTYKVSKIKDGEKSDIHAYNLVSYHGKYYIFDSTIPKVERDSSITPIVAKIPHHVYEKLIIRDSDKDDVSVKTKYKSIRGIREIHYNSWSKNVIDMTSSGYDEV